MLFRPALYRVTMHRMRRTGILVAVAVALLAVLAGAAVAARPVPRGTLTNVEYHEFLAVQKAEKQKPKTSNTAQIAKLDCSPLTTATRLTSTQHAECVASLFFFPRMLGFTGDLAHCEKANSKPAALHCIVRATDAMYRATRNFNTTNAASVKAADARGIAGKCLDYLVFTARQAKVVTALAQALRGFENGIQSENAVTTSRFGKRLTTELSAALKVFDVTGDVSVCRRQ
jgi:hypothetical protein